MGLGISGGLGQDVNDVLLKQIALQYADQIQKQKIADMEMAREEAAQRMQLDRQDSELRAEQFRAQQEERARKVEVEGLQRREADNQKGMRRMAADFVLQRQGNMTPQDRRQLAALQLEAEGTFDANLLEEPEVKQVPVNTVNERNEPVTMRVPENDPRWQSGFPQYREPKTGPAPDRTDYKLVSPTGEQRVVEGVADANSLLAQGWKWFDQVGARNTPSLNDEGLRTSQEVYRVAKDLRDHPSRGSVFGALEGALPNLKQGSIDAQALVDQLNGLMALENMGKMKGVLSDSDMRIIQQASSRLKNQRIGDAAAYQELNTIIGLVEKRLMERGVDLGGGAAPAATAPPIRSPN